MKVPVSIAFVDFGLSEARVLLRVGPSGPTHIHMAWIRSLVTSPSPSLGDNLGLFRRKNGLVSQLDAGGRHRDTATVHPY